MLQQINKTLLEKYPLLWNMRVATFGLVILATHLLHFLIGYLSFAGIEGMRWHSPEDMFFSSTFALFSIIGSFVIFILWLLRYLRNNAFKSLYPFSNGRLFGEFLILFAVTILNITYYYSYTFGYVLHARTATDFTMTQKDRALYSKVSVLLDENMPVYDLAQRCWPAPFPLQKHYLSDSVGADSAAYIVNTAEGNVIYTGNDGHMYSRTQLNALTGGFQHSYLNRCDYRYYDSETTEPNSNINNKGTELLLRKDSAEIKAAMKEFLAMCDRYHIKYRIDLDEWFRWVYNPPFFPVKYTLRNLPDYDNSTNFDEEALITTSEYNPSGFYLQNDRLERILHNTYRVHRYHMETEALSVFFYCAMGLSIMIFSFRATSRRIWLISIVGMCLLSLFLGAVSAMIISGSDSGEAVLLFYLLLIFVFLAVAIWGNSKVLSGVALTWFLWTSPLIIPMLAGMYMISERSERIAEDGSYHEPPFSNWITHHYGIFFLTIILAYILILLAVTPLCRKWQAMPED